jgi:hypothetical protein
MSNRIAHLAIAFLWVSLSPNTPIAYRRTLLLYTDMFVCPCFSLSEPGFPFSDQDICSKLYPARLNTSHKDNPILKHVYMYYHVLRLRIVIQHGLRTSAQVSPRFPSQPRHGAPKYSPKNKTHISLSGKDIAYHKPETRDCTNISEHK